MSNTTQKKTYIAHKKGRVTIEKDLSEYKVDHIPPGVWMFDHNEDGDIGLKKVCDRFTVPADLHDHVIEISRCVFDSYRERSGKTPTGALFHGTAGTGKSVTAKAISNLCLTMDVPVILVQENAVDPRLIRSFASITPCVVLFEEMEKTYGRHSDNDKDQRQDSLLTLLSDADLKSVLFLATANELAHVHNHMIFRPGRFLYNVDFDSLKPATNYPVLLEATGLTGWKKVLFAALYEENKPLTTDQQESVLEVLNASDDYEEIEQTLRLLNFGAVRTVFPDTLESSWIDWICLKGEQLIVGSTDGDEYVYDLCSEDKPFELYPQSALPTDWDTSVPFELRKKFWTGEVITKQ